MAKNGMWISSTSSLLHGVQTINKIDNQKFPFVLNRIVQFLQSPTEAGRPFTADEEEKLISTLEGIENADDLQSVLETSTFIFSQAIYHLTKPAVLQKDLMSVLQMTVEKAEAFATVWTNCAKCLVDKIRQKSIQPVQLENVNWMLNVTGSCSTKGIVNEPRAVIELQLKDESSAGGTGGTSNIVMDLNHKQLCALYDTLETIQTALDNLR
ncbi:COMM domain-containing protein 10 [Nilaparvata lugens]|uniref:COMM domain-containing protein 10 n=1 Tax=Nilaparvata lugens TaxID=108931 RepID=UPI00193DC1C1|nr:COMM domain-containing protein 10 [Nilaparvata lugens]